MGEFDVITDYFAQQTKQRADVRILIGDDAAIVQPPPQCELAFTTDTLIEGVHREVLEESGYAFTPTALLGVYVSDRWDKDITYLRFTFIGTVGEHAVSTQLDEGILSAEWLTFDEIMANEAIHRNKIVAQCLRDYQAGQSMDLALVKDLRTIKE